MAARPGIFARATSALARQTQAFASTVGSPSITQGPSPSTGEGRRALGFDLAKSFQKLPRSCISILEEMAQEQAEITATLRVLSDQIGDARDERQVMQSRRGQLMDRNYQAKPLTADDPMITKMDHDIGRHTALIERLAPRRDHLEATRSSLAHLLNHNLEPYVQRLDRVSDRSLWLGAAASPKKGESLDDAIERCRRRVRELHSEAEAVRASPLSSAVVIEAEVSRINALAELGMPDALFSIERGEPLRWPTLMNRPEMTGFEPVGVAIKTPDYMAIMAAMFRERMIEIAKQAILSAADDEAALSNDERAKRLDQIERDKLAVERDEVALIRAAKQQHQPIIFRPDTDARAFLGLADSFPAPRPQ